MGRFRVTIRGDSTELRGYATLEALAVLTGPPGEQPYIVAISPADDDYDPFKDQDLRELHHFETEQDLDKMANELVQANNNHADMVRKYRQREEFIRVLREEMSLLRQQFASPPPGWEPFGTNIDYPGPVEFWGNEHGLPIWERRVIPTLSAPSPEEES
jgi:hypothetical protein